MDVPRLALALGIASLGCSLSIAGFFVGVPLGLLAVLLALGGRGHPRGTRPRRYADRALAIGALGLAAGLGVWFVHVRAAQTAYHLPPRGELDGEFDHKVGAATAPLPGAPPRAPLHPTPALDQDMRSH
jgi:hypothetical protein